MKRNSISLHAFVLYLLFVLCVCAVGAQQSAPDSSNEIRSTTSLTSQNVPRMVRFSGVVHDLGGEPLTGSVDVRFGVYKEQGDAQPIWQETQAVQFDDHGRYTVLLGATQPQGLPRSLFETTDGRWLGVTAGNLPERPRAVLVSVPYALKSSDADTLGGKPASAYMLADSADTGSQGTTPGALSASSIVPARRQPTGTVTRIDTGPGLTGGPITTRGTISVAPGGITDAMLENHSVTLLPGSGLLGGGLGSLGGTLTLNTNPAVTGTSGIFRGTTNPVVEGGYSDPSNHSFGELGAGSIGVVGNGNDTGVSGQGFNLGVFGSGQTAGVYGTSDLSGVVGAGTDVGVSGAALTGVEGSGSANGVYGSGPGYGVFSKGNLGWTGSSGPVVALADNRVVELNAIGSPENWFEDFGVAELHSGVAEVVLDRTFALSVNTGTDYHVFLTPNGECEGLYVAAKTANGFEVRELRHGQSSISFDYRIVARRRGFERIRLEQLQADAKTLQAIRASVQNRPAVRKLVLPDEPKRPVLPKVLSPPASPLAAGGMANPNHPQPIKSASIPRQGQK